MGVVPRRYRGLGVGTIALMVAGTVFTVLAALSLWSWRTFASSEGFADVTTDMLKEPAIDEILAQQILLNNWIDTGTPNPSIAKDANGDRLRDRVARCAAIRGHMPNLIAVDFYSQGDLMQIVDDINGVGNGDDEVLAAS